MNNKMNFIYYKFTGFGRYNDLENKPINTDYIVTFFKSDFARYPDNKGIPTIVFETIKEAGTIIWYFETQESRDKVYDILYNLLKITELIV